MKRFDIRLTVYSREDLARIGEYIEGEVSRERALSVTRSIRQVMATLSEMSNRGALVEETLGIGVREFREIRFKPYRIIYQVTDQTVIVHLVADGRRDMRTLLMRRLLQA